MALTRTRLRNVAAVLFVLMVMCRLAYDLDRFGTTPSLPPDGWTNAIDFGIMIAALLIGASQWRSPKRTSLSTSQAAALTLLIMITVVFAKFLLPAETLWIGIDIILAVGCAGMVVSLIREAANLRL